MALALAACAACLLVSTASASESKAVKQAVSSQLYPPVGNDWTGSEGAASNLRYSSLDQITTANVGKLKVAFTTSTYPSQGYSSLGVESTPVEAGGVLYVPTTVGVNALDATTGATKWQYQGVPNTPGFIGEKLAARALAIGDGMVFAGQADGSVVALDTATGKVKWTAQVASVGTIAKKSAQISIPFTVYAKGVVLTGLNGGDSPLRGHIDAYNAKTGKLMWRFFTLPDLNNPAIKTWGNPAEAATGGAAIWSIPAVDTQLNRVYVGTGNAFPYTGRAQGQSLYANSEVSLDLHTGQLKWYFQAVHHDEWDYDCPTPPVLYNAPANGTMVKAVAFSCKSGYVYILNRATGKPIFPIPETPIKNVDDGQGAALNHTWPTQPIPTGGEAEILPHCPTAAELKDVLPGFPTAPNHTPYVPACPYTPTNSTHYVVWGPYFAFGGTDYPPMSFDPATNDLYVCANVTFQSDENKSPKTQVTTYQTGGGWTSHGESGTVTALNVTNNTLAWQVKYNAANNGACYSGAMSTAGGLVFVSSRGQSSGVPKPFGGTFYALDAKTGKTLFKYRNSSLIMAPAITYMVGGKQYVAVDMTGGTNSVALPGFGSLTTSTNDKLTVFALPSK
jgi:quinohemoprotein ethanol dehydrogenase